MKILHITASYKPAYIYGGPIYSVAALCEALINEGGVLAEESCASPPLSMTKKSVTKFDLQVITTLANGKEELPYVSRKQRIVDGVPVRYFKRWTKDHSHFSPPLLFWLWKNARNYEVIHIHSWWNLVSMGAVCICLLRGIKPIVSPRGMLSDYTFSRSKSFFHQYIGKYLLRKCDFHATTLMEAKEIEIKVGSPKLKIRTIDLQEAAVNSQHSVVIDIRIYVIHNIVNLPVILPQKTRVFDGKLHLIFLSRIHPKKGIELLMEVLAQISFPFTLTIVGEGEEEYLNRLKFKAEFLKIKDNISWMGVILGDEKFKLLAENDLFVLPSFNENFANVVIESLAVGTPVLLSEKVGLKDYIEKNQLGIIFKLDELATLLPSIYDGFKNETLRFNSINPEMTKNNLLDNYQIMYKSL